VTPTFFVIAEEIEYSVNGDAIGRETIAVGDTDREIRLTGRNTLRRLVKRQNISVAVTVASVTSKYQGIATIRAG
jgi:hypothetical protein